MPRSQILLTFLYISYSITNIDGFSSTYLPRARIAITSIDSNVMRDPRSLYSNPQPRSGRRFRNRCVAWGKPKTSSTDVGSQSEKVKAMAAFVSIQLLEMVMREAMKEDGESTIDLESVERLTKALQMSSQTSSETPTKISDKAEGTDKVKDVDTQIQESPVEETNKISDLDSSIPLENAGKTNSPSSVTKEDNSVSDTTKVQAGEALSVKEEKIEVPDIAKATLPKSDPVIIRQALEVVQSDIPPLRPESVPKKSESGVEDNKHDSILLEPIKEDSEAVEERSLQSSDSDGIDIVSDVDVKKVDESFQRRLLEQKLKIDAKELKAKKGESTISNIVSNRCEDDPGSSNLTSERSPQIISERRVETIVALRQPKSAEEECKLAKKYAEIANLEDRAYALLLDLGMVDVNKNPKDSSYDHSKDDEYCEQRFREIQDPESI